MNSKDECDKIKMMNINNITFKTKRTFVRKLKEDDFDTFCDYMEDNGYDYSIDEYELIYNKTLNDQDTLGIFLEEELIGAIVIHDTIGYSIKRNYRNQKYMSEVLNEYINYMFSNQFSNCIKAYVDKNNLCSQKVLLNNNFIKTKEDEKYNYYERRPYE